MLRAAFAVSGFGLKIVHQLFTNVVKTNRESEKKYLASHLFLEGSSMLCHSYITQNQRSELKSTRHFIILIAQHSLNDTT